MNNCPNCGSSFPEDEDGNGGLASLSHANSGCVLGALVGVVVERETCPIPSDEKVANLDADVLWDRLGPIIDDLERQLTKDLLAQIENDALCLLMEGMLQKQIETDERLRNAFSKGQSMKWPYKDKSEGPLSLEVAVQNSASRSKENFLSDAGLAWDRMKNKKPVTRRGKDA
jgi:hypothetical protein